MRLNSLTLFVATCLAALLAVPASAQSHHISFATDEGTWMSLDVSPDGRTLIIELLGDIYALSTEGGRAEPLLTGRPFQSQPRFSPDGRRLVYVSDETGSDNLWLAASDGSGARALTDLDATVVLSPAWSADGAALYTTVVTSTGFSSQAELWRFDAATGEGTKVLENLNGASQPLVSAPSPGPYGPVSHPDGRYVYYTSLTPRPYGSRNGPSAVIERVAVDGTGREPVTVESSIAMRPALTADGLRLVYAAVRQGRAGFKVRDLDGGTERWLAWPIQRPQLESRATRDVLPNFAVSRDGRSLFAAWDGRVRRIDLESGAQEFIPFEADVSLEVEPRLHSPRRVEEGPVRTRLIQQVAVGPGEQIAFSALGRIWITDDGESSAKRLTQTTRPREFMPAWSENGDWIAFVTWDESGGHIWKAPTDGEIEPMRLTDQPAAWADPVWTKDGRGVVALRAPLASSLSAAGPGGGAVPDGAHVVYVPEAGGPVRILAPAGDGRRPHFGVDPDQVYLSSPTRGLVSVPLQGGETLVAATVDGRAELRLSPDGASVLSIRGPAMSVHPVADRGLVGDVLPEGSSLPLSTGSPALVGWSPSSDRVSSVTGGLFTSVAVANSAAEPTSRDLMVSVAPEVHDQAAVLRGATVLTMRGNEVIVDADVVVVGNRIAGVGPRGSVRIPEGANEFDLQGHHIVPGFIDVHAHFTVNGELPRPEGTTSFANLAFGITTLRNPQTSPQVFALADMIDADGVPGPRIFSTGPGLFRSSDFSTPEAARGSIERYPEAWRTHLLKWYLAGNRGERRNLVEAAKALDLMPTTEGGADTKADLTYAIDGFSGLEHAFPATPIHDDIVQLVARTGITYTPTLVVAFGGALPIFRLLAEKRPHESARASRWFPDGALYTASSSRLLWFPPEEYNDQEVAVGANDILEAGGRVALGGHGEIQGLSAHWEMELLAAGGMTNHDVLRVATIMGAEAIGYEQDLGSIEAGKMADLVVLNRDPLADIGATQDIAYVMKDGRMYRAETLDEVWPRERPLVLPWHLARDPGHGTAIAAVEDIVRTALDEGRVPGMAVAVVRREETLMARGFGTADLETGAPVTERTMFQSGSLGKQWTSAGIMALVEDGLIDLDASVGTYIHEAPEAWEPITIRHLLTHSSGIPDYTSDGFDYETDYSESDLVAMASGLELEFPAGARWNYSNTGYVMLGVVMSRVTGRPYWEFLRERIFDPAGMPTIRVNTQSDVVPHRAQGYIPSEHGWQHAGYVAPTTNTTADGSMLVSLQDMIAWNDVVSRRVVLSEESWRVILSPMTLNSGRSYPYGFGWFLEKAGGQDVHQHGGTWQGFVTQFTRYDDDDLAIIVLGNARSMAVGSVAAQIASRLDPDLATQSPPSTPIPDVDPEATAYVAETLERIANGDLELGDFAFVRQTLFPRIRAALIGQLRGMGPPDRLELLASETIGDDRSFQYWAWYGDQRVRVMVSLGPDGGLTALRVVREGPR